MVVVAGEEVQASSSVTWFTAEVVWLALVAWLGLAGLAGLRSGSSQKLQLHPGRAR